MTFPTFSTPSRTVLARLAAVGLLLGGAAFGALAQTYKIVGPDGRVTYTDKPPSGAAPGTAGATTSGGGAAAGGLPYETRQASGKYPVTLYTAKVCPGCDGARQYLRGRGVPFSEYTANANDDLIVLQQRFGQTVLPVVTVGSQTVRGFSPTDLGTYLDAAGYPQQARLTGYSWPAAVPLAPPARPAAAASAAGAQPATPGVTLPPPSKNGIQF